MNIYNTQFKLSKEEKKSKTISKIIVNRHMI